MVLDVRSVAVIGGGPSGIASVYELTHTERGGISTITLEGDGKAAKNPQFTKIVGFEQRERAGGSWNPSFDQTDLEVPPQDILDTERYNEPDVISPPADVPAGLEGSSEQNPVKTDFDQKARDLSWRFGGVYKDLYTNVPARFTRFSYMENEDKFHDEKRTIYPLMSQVELCKRIQTFVAKEGIEKYYRFNSRVESVVKTESGKWLLSIRKVYDGDHEEWYQEEFDAVLVAIGHFGVPVFPHTTGLAEFNRNFPGVVSHANSYRNHEDFRDKKVLVVGGSISTMNTIQYVLRLAKSFTVALREENKVYKWVNSALRTGGVILKPQIDSIDGKTGEITFKDGSRDSGFDKIVFSTGYHFHFPFLKGLVKFDRQKRRLPGLYYNTFWIEDPTIASTGLTSSTLTFFCMETSAAAIAGVWSGVTELPSKEEQIKWEIERAESPPVEGFLYFAHTKMEEQFLKPMSRFFTKNRRSPFYKDGIHVGDVDIAVDRIQKIFYSIRDGKLPIKDTLYE
ncbi:hypothetical protein PSN45_001527 [Yamadazyma tenuis]|uniref:uncharacterized protein n=1 Tax=Candida tenuis TaxID=2315449 RepID=UPI0027A57492|nr:hypothetical protein PSN45_001527 [Yamadazyma tenuis]